MTTTFTSRYTHAKQTLDAIGQGHVLHFFDSLDDPSQDRLLSEIKGIDWTEVAALIESHVKAIPSFEPPDCLEPAPWYPNVPPPSLRNRYNEARSLGEQLLREGKVAAFTVAGGQGTRLDWWHAPKGTFPATPIRGLSLFACFAEYLHKVARKWGRNVPWYIMTSPINDAETRDFFDTNDYFGLDPANLMLFPQGMIPAIDRQTARVLLQAPGRMALSPNGHGGSLRAIYLSGAIEDMKRRGIEHISYIQVDNPMVRVIDPLFLGLHAAEGAPMSSKMLPKRDPLEKLGHFCLVDGKIVVVEYSDLPSELAHESTPDGRLRFGAGSIAIHLIRVDFVESLNQAPSGFALPYHRAIKMVPYIDVDTGEQRVPTEANAVKLETFVFDALPLCPGTPGSIVYETSRIEEFAPIKNAPGVGVLDTPETSKQLQIERAARWLEAHGVRVPRHTNGTIQATLEISHRVAIEPDDLANVKLPGEIKAGSKLLL